MEAVLYRLRILLRQTWATTFAIAIVVALTGGLVLTLAAGAARTITAPDRYVDWQGQQFDVTVRQDGGEPRNAELEKLQSVARVEAATFVFGEVAAPGSGSSQNALVFSGSPVPLGMRLTKGRLPDPPQPGQFVATKSFVTAAHASIGDHFTLRTLTRQQGKDQGFDAGSPRGPSLKATLVGIVAGPSELEDGYALALFPPSLLKAGDVGVSATISAVSLRPSAHIADLRAQAAELPGGSRLDVQKAEPISRDVRSAVSAEGQGLAVLAAIVALTTLVVVGQVLSRQFRVADSELTILRSLGFTRAQSDGEPVARAAVAVVFGSIGAGIIAYASSASSRAASSPSSSLIPADPSTRSSTWPARRCWPSPCSPGCRPRSSAGDTSAGTPEPPPSPSGWSPRSRTRGRQWACGSLPPGHRD